MALALGARIIGVRFSGPRHQGVSMFSKDIFKKKYTIEIEQIFEKPNILYLPEFRFIRCVDEVEQQNTGYYWGITLGYFSFYKNYL